MTPEAKRLLSTTIRAVRARLLSDLHTATESAYRLSVRARDAELSEAAEVKRGRLETWIDEQVRALGDGKRHRTADDFRREVEKQAAYTLLNRLVILRLMEAVGLRKPAVATGGWESQGYKAFREIAPALIQGDEGEGYPFLLQLVFEDLATDLPGLYGSVGVADLVPIPTATLRYVIESLDVKELASCWDDDMTLGWVYQYWNDPEQALEAIGKEVQRRRRKKQAPQPELRILEPGLWSRIPDQCWDLELRVIEKQGEDFRLLAPDETDGRAAYERACPARVGQRARLLIRLRDERPLLPDEEFDDNEEDCVEEEDE